MKKTTKILICTFSVAVALLCVIIGINATQGGGEDETTTSGYAVVNPTTTKAPETTESTTQKNEPALAELLIGKWTDSAGMSGFEFFEGGKVSFNYANLAALGINFDGTVENGTYKLKGNTLTIAYSIYTATIDKSYEISIENDQLKMKNLEDGKISTYVRGGTNGNEATSDSTQSTTVASNSDELYGSWENKSMSKSYKFASSGKVTITLDGESFDGAYVSEGNKVTIQYTAYGKKITEKYTFSVTTNALTLTNDAGSEFVFVRYGTQVSSNDDEELLGKWRDSANMSGYEFKENGVVKITFVNIDIPVINVPVNGTFTGGYEIKNGIVTVTYYIYGNTIEESFTYEVSGNSLQLKNTEDGKISTYMKQ